MVCLLQNVTSEQSNAIILFGALAIGLGLVLATQIDTTQGVAARITDNMSQAEEEVSYAQLAKCDPIIRMSARHQSRDLSFLSVL